MSGPDLSSFQIVVIGGAGKSIVGPTSAGDWAPDLVDGTGTTGVADWFGLGCETPAGNGKPGNGGGGSISATPGGTGFSAPTFDLVCLSFTGKAMSLASVGGTGGNGGWGGTGGTGGTGGNAGYQPKACAKDHGPAIGGQGGVGGKGGDAGAGGNGGNTGDISVLLPQGVTPTSVFSNIQQIAGTGGTAGQYGVPGLSGVGGLNSDGSPGATGPTGSYGAIANDGNQGSMGKVSQLTATGATYAFRLSVTPQS